jgi:uncharacterized coiled-coil protein SlyX
MNERMVRIEEKIAYLQRMLDELDEVVRDLAGRVDHLQGLVDRLPTTKAGGSTDVGDEV